jgi:quaternary ammonium compound-resistance protein SugE
LNYAWTYLVLAGVFEIGWPLGFKLSQVTRFKITYILVAVLSMALSGLFLYLAQRDIPIGTAYAVWTGIGAAGTFTIGLLFFGDAATMLRMISFFFIFMGIVGLRISA